MTNEIDNHVAREIVTNELRVVLHTIILLISPEIALKQRKNKISKQALKCYVDCSL